MNGRRRIRSLVLVSAVLASLDLGCDRGPAPTLDGINRLLVSRQFDAVEKRIDDYLIANPDDLRANLLMAQVALNRDPQKPQQALDHLARIRTADRPTLAIIRLNEGKARSALGDHARAELSWREGLRLDPLVPEAGWSLLSLYYVEGRRREAEQMGLALHAIEPDPRDRVQLLLELVRQDARPIASPEIVRVLGPGVRDHPDDIHGAIALARARFRDSQPDEGLSLLNPLIERHPHDPELWDALLRGLDDSARPDEVAATLDRLPDTLAADPRFARFLGITAQGRRDWPTALKNLSLARLADPLDSQVVYRLGRVYRLTNRDAEAKKMEEEFRAVEATLREMLPLYNEANAVQGLGTAPAPDLYGRVGEARERLGYRAEALAWHRLALRDRPDDAASLAAVKRLADAKMPILADVLALGGG